MLVAQCMCKAIENFARAPHDVSDIFRFATRYHSDQLNETNRTVPNLPGCKRKVQTEICGAKIINYIIWLALQVPEYDASREKVG